MGRVRCMEMPAPLGVVSAPPSSPTLLSAVRSKQTPKVQKTGPVCHPPGVPVSCPMHGPTASWKDCTLDRGLSFLQRGGEERVAALGRVRGAQAAACASAVRGGQRLGRCDLPDPA